MRRIFTVLSAVIAALFLAIGHSGPAAAAAPIWPDAVLAYAYDSHAVSAQLSTSVSVRGPTTPSYAYPGYSLAVDTASYGTSTRPDAATGSAITIYAHPSTPALVAGATTTTGAQVQSTDGNLSSFRRSVGAAKSVDEVASMGFRSDATHIFREAAGHFAEDTPANRAIIRGAVDPANLRSTITLKDGATLSKYFRTLPDGTQAWAEVRNGTEITNGGLNVIPR